MDPSEPFATLPFEVASSSELPGARVALIGFEDPQLQAALKQHGATLVPPSDEEIDWLVVEATALDPGRWKQQLGESLVHRVLSGRTPLMDRQQVESLLQDDAVVRRMYTVAMLSDLLQVPVATIRGWHRRGLIQPVNSISKLPYFEFNEVLAAKQLATLVALGVQPNAIEKSLGQMARWLPEGDRSLAQISLLVDGHRLLLRRGGRLVEPGGQQRFDFGEPEHNKPFSSVTSFDSDEGDAEYDGDDAPAMILPLFSHPNPDNDSNSSLPLPEDKVISPEQLIRLAERLEEQGDLDDAIETYRSMQFAFGPDAETCLRLGELLYRTGQVRAARERYSMAIELDEHLVEARAALGCVLGELGETQLAIAAFEGALQQHPHYADVHFQLARLMQATGHVEQSLSHWKSFLQLDPDGPWAEEARLQIAIGEAKKES